MAAVAVFTAIALLCYASAENITTSLLLPDVLFTAFPVVPSAFLGQVTISRSTTYYILDCNADGVGFYFYPGNEGGGSSYTFSEISAGTQYLFENVDTYTAPDVASTGAASTSLYTDVQIGTINCSPLDTSGSATCTTTFIDEGISTDTEIESGVESTLYPVIFTAAAGYNTASSTTATPARPSPTSSAPTPNSTANPSPTNTTTINSSLTRSSKIGIGLGVPFGACALAGVALLLYRHGKHKERSRRNQMGNLAPPGGVFSDSEGKKMAEAAVDSQILGRQPPVYSMEMQG